MLLTSRPMASRPTSVTRTRDLPSMYVAIVCFQASTSNLYIGDFGGSCGNRRRKPRDPAGQPTHSCQTREVHQKDDARCHIQRPSNVKHGRNGRDEHGGGARED